MKTSLYFWYVTMTSWFWHRAGDSIGAFDSTLALGPTLRNISKPLFQDFTLQGRLVGLLLRVARIFVALFLYSLIGLFWLILYVAWIGLPALATVALVKAFRS